MKYFGCVLEFTRQRNDELLRAYNYQISKARHIRVLDIAAAAVAMPASRFWVSEERASIVVSALLRGDPILETMHRSKRAMFEEIYRRFIIERHQNPCESQLSIVTRIVNSPAPCFYMLPRTAMETIFKIKNGFYDRRFDRYSSNYSF